MALACNTCVSGLASQYEISLRRQVIETKQKGTPIMRQAIPLVNQVFSSTIQFVSLVNQPISLGMNGQTATRSIPVYIEHDFRDQIISQSHQSHKLVRGVVIKFVDRMELTFTERHIK